METLCHQGLGPPAVKKSLEFHTALTGYTSTLSDYFYFVGQGISIRTQTAGRNPLPERQITYEQNRAVTMADMHKSNGNTAKALELYEHGAALTPADPMIAYNLFLLHRKRKQHKMALAVLSRLLEASIHVRDRKNLQWCESAYRKLTGREWGHKAATNQSTKTLRTPAPSAGRKAEIAEGSDGPTILIVDDEPHIRMLLERSLEPLEDDGATLLFAANGEEGLHMIKDRRPELVFLDVMMPRMNGFEVCRIVKHELGMSDVYVIMLTAKGQEFDRKKGLEAGADVYMTKPFRPRELANLARAVLDM